MIILCCVFDFWLQWYCKLSVCSIDMALTFKIDTDTDDSFAHTLKFQVLGWMNYLEKWRVCNIFLLTWQIQMLFCFVFKNIVGVLCKMFERVTWVNLTFVVCYSIKRFPFYAEGIFLCLYRVFIRFWSTCLRRTFRSDQMVTTDERENSNRKNLKQITLVSHNPCN